MLREEYNYPSLAAFSWNFSQSGLVKLLVFRLDGKERREEGGGRGEEVILPPLNHKSHEEDSHLEIRA